MQKKSDLIIESNSSKPVYIKSSNKAADGVVFFVHSMDDNIVISSIAKKVSEFQHVVVLYLNINSSDIKYNNPYNKKDFNQETLSVVVSAWEDLKLKFFNIKKYSVIGAELASWASMQLVMRRPEISCFVCINPDINLYDFSFLSPCPCPGNFVLTKNNLIFLEKSQDVAEKISLGAIYNISINKFLDQGSINNMNLNISEFINKNIK